ncbi:MAG: HemK2/MTQ2 family protein methyltransferase [Candidatus Micrarchaeia archaeon]|jgi:release factor glutamine methyltransferase
MQKIEFDSLIFEIFPEVYLPAEDSFFLANYSKNLKGRILEIGCGCGIASIICAKNNPENIVYGIDISQKAVENSNHNAKLNDVKNVHFINSDLFRNVFGKFDSIMFNPPYLPTSDEEKINSVENYAYDGGKNGRKTIDLFLDNFERHLNENGKILLIQSSLNDLDKTISVLKGKNFSVEILDEESFFFEKLSILRAEKT